LLAADVEPLHRLPLNLNQLTMALELREEHEEGPNLLLFVSEVDFIN
jgi:hypothetical protein